MLATQTVFEHTLSVLQSVYHFLQPHEPRRTSLLAYALASIANIFRGYVWFILLGLVIYVFRRIRSGGGLSLFSGLKHLLPGSVYSHRSLRVDLAALPISIVLDMFVMAAVTVSAVVAYTWLARIAGPSPVTIHWLGFAVALQVVITLLATDFGHYLWHLQAHKVPFFWSFHKGHHSAEVLHPFFVRTHPVDDIIRTAYMSGGGGLMGGAAMWLIGIHPTATAAAYLGVLGAGIDMIQSFEHSTVWVSFGWLNRVFYAPCLHFYHHSADPRHFDKNLGLTGGLTLWDRMFGTLFLPNGPEVFQFGASMEELGDNNPHRSLWLFLYEPFKSAARALRGVDVRSAGESAPSSIGSTG
jgi:sterol desaturase/sphingolipid hydroxylase (fatty acid hydroxylase superfamily)